MLSTSSWLSKSFCCSVGIYTSMAQVNHPSRLSQEPIERLNFEDFRRIKREGRTRLVTSLERFGIYGSVGEGMIHLGALLDVFGIG
mmetsp:Transcript_3472/g.13767  ORF Transcript_3472/g.13767 Transcript_3472/m.13767 type:complete len:86 (-) Transcript_3472:147-404(-)